MEEEMFYPKGKTVDVINETIKLAKTKAANIHTSDVFLQKNTRIPAIAENIINPAVEMGALFASMPKCWEKCQQRFWRFQILFNGRNFWTDQKLLGEPWWL